MFYEDPAQMSADERLDELAGLLAAGFLRLKCRRVTAPTGEHPAHVSPEKSPKNSPELSGGVPRT
jgi:hypothetical protein